MNLLFVCSRNKWRSPTAETIFKNRRHCNVKSAGTERSARIKLTSKLIEWSDIIFVMEKKHKQRITSNFPDSSSGKNIIILNIPDEYQYMDEELIEMLELSVRPHINIEFE